MNHPPIQAHRLDQELSRLAAHLETYTQGLSDLVDQYDAMGAQLALADPESWRAESASPDPQGLLSIEEQFRREVDRIVKQDREQEARLARRLEFARLRFDRALERAGIDPDDLGGQWPKLSNEGLSHHGHSKATQRAEEPFSGLPHEVLQRWTELHALRTELVECNLYLVLINVERYKHTRVSRMDLIQEGSSVLFRAADGFEWRRGLLFRTYAVHWLNQAFRSYLYNFGHTVRLPVYLQKAMKHVRAAVDRLGDGPHDPKTIAEQTDLGENVVISALGASRATYSIDSSFGHGGGEGLSLRETLTKGGLAGLYEANMEDISLEQGVEMALSRLGERERLVIGMRFGLEGGEEHTLAQIAQHMGVSLERVRQIQVRAITKMKTAGLRRAVDPFLL